jgi:hypothetical protein
MSDNLRAGADNRHRSAWSFDRLGDMWARKSAPAAHRHIDSLSAFGQAHNSSALAHIDGPVGRVDRCPRIDTARVAYTALTAGAEAGVDNADVDNSAGAVRTDTNCRSAPRRRWAERNRADNSVPDKLIGPSWLATVPPNVRSN